MLNDKRIQASMDKQPFLKRHAKAYGQLVDCLATACGSQAANILPTAFYTALFRSKSRGRLSTAALVDCGYPSSSINMMIYMFISAPLAYLLMALFYSQADDN
jgi:hypothetical protein